jgi:hypothetical protein
MLDHLFLPKLPLKPIVLLVADTSQTVSETGQQSNIPESLALNTVSLSLLCRDGY